MKVTDELIARGHPNILATHPTTFEITKAKHVTSRGDCVIGVNATKGPRSLSKQFKELCRNSDAKIIVRLQAGGIVETVEGRGAPELTFGHLAGMVGRKSSFVSDRTIMIKADRAASDLSRPLIEALRSSATTLYVRIIVEF